MSFIAKAAKESGVSLLHVLRYHMGKLASIRVLWNWLLGAMFLWACWYGMTRIPASANTIIITLGGVFSAMMSNYVWSSYNERKNEDAKVIGKQASAPIVPADDSSAGD